MSSEQIVEINDNASETSDTQHHASQPTTSLFKLINVLENLILMGMCSLDIWDQTLNKLKTNIDVITDPEIFNLYCVLRDLFNILSSTIYTKLDILSPHKLPIVNSKEMTVDEIMDYLKSTLKKNSFKSRAYSVKAVQTLMKCVHTLLENESSETELNKRKNENNDSSTSSKKVKTCALDEENEDEFDKIFSSTLDSSKPVIIKQILHHQLGKERKKLTTPGETGDYLVKIEVTETKDLQKCKSEKNFWMKVGKKAYFLVDKEDDILKDVNNIILRVGKKISKISDVTSSTTEIEERK